MYLSCNLIRDIVGYFWKVYASCQISFHQRVFVSDSIFIPFVFIDLLSLGKVSLTKAFDLIDYLTKEDSTAPISQALFQLNLIYNLVEKRGMQELAGRVVVSLPVF